MGGGGGEGAGGCVHALAAFKYSHEEVGHGRTLDPRPAEDRRRRVTRRRSSGLPAPTRRGPGRPGGLCLNATGRRLSRHSAIGESASGF